MHLDVTMDGSGIDVNVQGVGYTSRQVVNAIDGATITPDQVGTEADPVKQQHAESISSGEVSVTHNGSPAYTEQVVAKIEDADNTTPLSLDTGDIGSTYQYLKLKGHISGHGGGAFEDVSIQLGDFTEGYTTNYIEDGTVGSLKGPSWKTEMYNKRHQPLNYEIFADEQTAEADRGPSIFGSWIAHSQAKTLLNGNLSTNGGIMPVRSVQISTPFNATAKLVVVGVTY